MDDENAVGRTEAWLRSKATDVVLLARTLKCLSEDGLDRLADAADIPALGKHARLPRPGTMARAVAGLVPADAKDAMALDAVATAIEAMRDALLSETLFLAQRARPEAENAAPELIDVRALLDGSIAELKRRKNRPWNPDDVSAALSEPLARTAAGCRAAMDAGQDPGRHAEAAKALADRASLWLSWIL